MAISPKDILKEKSAKALLKAQEVPNFVYKIFDELTVSNYSEVLRASEVKQKDVEGE